jgi:sporulation protein YlmC with PRC-barrel domain
VKRDFLKMAKPEVREGKIGELIPDQKNANRGTEYGNHLLEKSLRGAGAGRSVLADKNLNLLAGNKTAEKFGEIGMEDIIIVETDGTKLVVVQRTDIDIDSKEGRELALADNQVGRVNLDFDPDVISDLGDEFDINIADWGLDLLDTPKVKAEKEITGQLPTEHKCPSCGHTW